MNVLSIILLALDDSNRSLPHHWY